MRVQRLATVPIFAEILKVWGGAYLRHYWSDWPKIMDLVLWVPKPYQVSLKSETVGFKFSVILGDLTRNDPILYRSFHGDVIRCVQWRPDRVDRVDKV